MSSGALRPWALTILGAGTLFLGIPHSLGGPPSAPRSEWREAYLHLWKLRTFQDLEDLLKVAQAAHLNVLVALANWFPSESELAAQKQLVDRAARQGLEVHAWFMNGQQPSQLLAVNRSLAYRPMFGDSERWSDLCNPQMHQLQAELMLKRLAEVPFQGLHLDCIRFFGGLGSVSEATRAAARANGLDLQVMETEVYGALPLPAAPLFGNRLTEPTTAQVLAQFDDGVPALTWNEVGQGGSVVVNLQSGVFEMPWVGQTLGYTPIPLSLEDLAAGAMKPGLPLLCPRVYQFSDAEAAALLAYTRAGGFVVFIEGPVLAIAGSPALQELTGFSPGADYLVVTPYSSD